jgi:hypothetical protein
MLNNFLRQIPRVKKTTIGAIIRLLIFTSEAEN